jgi:hypothetical protein
MAKESLLFRLNPRKIQKTLKLHEMVVLSHKPADSGKMAADSAKSK